MSWKRGVYCIDDPAEGVGLYRLGSDSRIRTFQIPIKRSMRPRKVAFVEECRRIVSGSDHGVVYVFNRRTGETVAQLKTDGGWLQTVTVSRLGP